jgi:acetolactate synthase I/II/III large subunit
MPDPLPATVAHQMVAALRVTRIDTLFCLPGVQNDVFFDALIDAPEIRPIVTRHEQGAAYMAMGAAQVSGRPAAFCVVPGPGMLNASAALTSAYWGHARVLAIVGQIALPLQHRGVGTLHDLPDPTAILQQLTKHTAVVHDAARATSTIQTALDAVSSGTPRPVSIEVPVDVWGEQAPGEIAPPQVTMPTPDPKAVERAAALLVASRAPMIVVGSGAYGASAEVVELAELLQAVVTTRRMGHGVVPTAHPLFVPITAAHELWPQADVVLGIGSRIEWPLGTWGFDDQLTLIQVNTDRDELDRHGIAAASIHADASVGCRALIDAIGSLNRPSRTRELDAVRSRFENQTRHLEPQRSFCAAIRDVLPDDGVIVEDVTQIGFGAHLFYDHRRPRTYLSSGAAGTLGAGTAVAIGAATATDSPVVGLTGDGGFLFTATELATAVQHEIPVTILLFNDGAYGNVRRIQRSRFGADRTIASSLTNPDFGALAASFGVRYWRATSPTDLGAALGAAIDHDGPALVEVPVDEMPDPWPFLRMAPNRGLTASRYSG